MQQKNREERKEVWRSSTGTGSSEAVGGVTTVMASHQQGAAALLGPPRPRGCAGAMVTLSLVSWLCFWNLE